MGHADQIHAAQVQGTTRVMRHFTMRSEAVQQLHRQPNALRHDLKKVVLKRSTLMGEVAVTSKLVTGQGR